MRPHSPPSPSLPPCALPQALSADPSLVNSAAEAGGWFVKVELADAASATAGLLDAAAYKKVCEAEKH